MGAPYEESHRREWRVDVPLDVVWEYILDAEAQVRHDRRIEAIALESGAWGAPGSVMSITGINAAGVVSAVRVRLEASVPPHFYRTREETADVSVVTTVTTAPDGAGTLVTTLTEVTTRPLNWLERIAVKRSRGQREREADVAAEAARLAVSEYYASKA
jgi:hypothetical protein